MNSSLKPALIRTLSVLLVLVIFTLAVMCIDVKEVYVTETGIADDGTEKAEIGLSGLNIPVAKSLGFSETWYKISEYCGYLAILIAAAFAGIALFQWIKRRKLLSVDTQLLALGIFFVIVILVYLVFTKVSINVRPVIVDPEEWPEPSFPSSHTLLAVCVIMGAIRVLPVLCGEKNTLRTVLTAAGLAIMAVAVVSRLLSGVHWLTDIIASLIFSALLICVFPFLESLVEKIKDSLSK